MCCHQQLLEEDEDEEATIRNRPFVSDRSMVVAFVPAGVSVVSFCWLAVACSWRGGRFDCLLF